jgi:hypothetical protein
MEEKKKRGFATMDRTKVREIASLGGLAAHRMGTAHEFSHDEAVAAGRKGGLAKRRPRVSMRAEAPPTEPESSPSQE